MKEIMIIVLVITCFGLACVSRALAQSTGQVSIKGIVADEQKSPIPYATVILRKLPDSSYSQSLVSGNNGGFLFAGVQPGGYFIQISSIGFKKENFAQFIVSTSSAEIDLGPFTMTKTTGILGEVTITGKTPLIEKQIDRTVVNVAGSIRAEGTTALELLQQLPGVVVSSDGQITLNGKTGINVMIDGKATQVSADDLANLLRSMSSSQIQKIEIMSNPSAKYDAAGTGGMINIIRNVNKASGWTGSVFAGFNQSRYAGYNGGFTLNDKEKGYNFYFSNTFTDNKRWQETDLTSHILNPDQSQYQSQISQNQSTRTGKSYLPSLGLDLYLSPKTTLSLSGTATIQNLDNLTNSAMNEYDGDNSPTANLSFLNNNEDHPYSYTTGAIYRATLTR